MLNLLYIGLGGFSELFRDTYFLVGFTVSTFSLETLSLLQDGHLFLPLINVVSNAGLCLLAGWFGLILSRLSI
ncbi:MAG: hypothetical protein LWW94_09180 [Candidatus Desulfofervidaceae bacterium]|nr:hypothetical protein [Candidatus Desulfofervidaceae bacterium]